MNGEAITLAMTGASGAPYGLRLLEYLLKAGQRVYFMISAAGQVVLAHEMDIKVPGRPADMEAYFNARFGVEPGQLTVLARDAWFSPPASGSGAPARMVVCPCTSGSLSAIASGASDNLIERAADVVIKEQGRLILVLREMPLSAIHLENMLKLARLGVVIMPANPGFYHHPRSLEDLVDFVVARILDHLGVTHDLVAPWGAAPET